MGNSSACRIPFHVPGAPAVRRALRILAATALTVTALAAPVALRAQDEEQSDAPEQSFPPVTRTFAIRNARIVQGPGRIIERGTVVARNGVIVAVGTNVTIPFDAKVIEGDSLTVYAGFIDGLSYAGVPKQKDEKPAKVARPGNPPDDRAGIQPGREIRTLLKPDDSSVDSLRMLGFTVAHAVPRGRMLPGTGAIILLGGDTPERMILRDRASLFAQFTPAQGDVYPATPMGVMAKWRQLYREADRRKRVQTNYDERPTGMERPVYDATLYSFFPVIDGRMPVAFRAENPLEARRALKLSRELGFPVMITGLKEGSDLASELKSRNVPLFVSLDLPRDRAAGKKDSVSTVDSLHRSGTIDTVKAVTPRSDNFIGDERTLTWEDVAREKTLLEARQRQHRRQYFANAAELRRQGLRYGFASAGAAAGDIRENIELMLRSGLSEDDALAALTVDAARLLGLESSLGTVEPGKMANLVVTDGNYFRVGTQVRHVFVDGREYDYEPSKKKPDTSFAELSATTGADSLRPNPALAGARATSGKGSLLIRNGTVLTITNGTLENTDVLVENGRIAKIGKGLQAPGGAQTIDATGQFVMPGIIDAHSHIAVSGEVNEWTNPVTAEVAIRDVLDPNDISIYRALAGGVTESHVMHGSANVIGGQCQTIKLRYGVTDPEALVMEGAPRTIKFALGENPTRVHGRGFNVQPSTRMGVEMVMRQAFTEARRYMQAQERYQRERSSNPRAAAPAYDLRMETLAAILRGEIIVNCHSYRADEILMVMKVFRDFGIKRLVFQHVNEGFKVAPELAAFGAGASVFSDWWAYKFEVYYSTSYNAAILTRNGVLTSINSDSPELDRHLNHEAAKAQRYGGLTADEAMAMITINPARQLGIDARVGSIEVGKDADLAIFSAHPLSVYAICQRTIVDGIVRFDRERDPDDMRLWVDPKGSVETATVRSTEEEDACMRGTEHLFHRSAR